MAQNKRESLAEIKIRGDLILGRAEAQFQISSGGIKAGRGKKTVSERLRT